MAADALSRYPVDVDAKMVGSELSVIEGCENASDYGEELEVEETPLVLSINFEGPLCAPMLVTEQESWLVDYWKDHEMRAKYFNVAFRELKNPTQWH